MNGIRFLPFFLGVTDVRLRMGVAEGVGVALSLSGGLIWWVESGVTVLVFVLHVLVSERDS